MAPTQAQSTSEAKSASPVDLSTIPISPEGDENLKPKASPNDPEQITVFHDPENFNVKHPLMNKWTLWFTKPPSGKASTASLHLAFLHLLTYYTG